MSEPERMRPAVLFHGVRNARNARILAGVSQHCRIHAAATPREFRACLPHSQLVLCLCAEGAEDAEDVPSPLRTTAPCIPMAALRLGKPIVCEQPRTASSWLLRSVYHAGVHFIDALPSSIPTDAQWSLLLRTIARAAERAVAPQICAQICSQIRERLQYANCRAQLALLPRSSRAAFPVPYPVRVDMLLCIHCVGHARARQQLLQQAHAPRPQSYDVCPTFECMPAAVGRAMTHCNAVWNARRRNLPQLAIFESRCIFSAHFRATYARLLRALQQRAAHTQIP